MKMLQEKLNFILDKYDVSSKAVLLDSLNVEIDGITVSMLPWRNERRFTELKNLVINKTVYGISVLRFCRIDKKDKCLKNVFARELDLCRWILEDEIKDYKYFANSGAINAVVNMKSGVVCTVEAAITLNSDSPVIDKHEIITQRGIACDKVVDTQIPQNSVYLFSEDNKGEYLDVDFELFGCHAEEVALIRHAFALAKNEKYKNEIIKASKQLEEIMSGVKI